MHIKGVCQEVDWLFPIWKRVMIGREKKANRLLLFYWWTSLGVSFWSLSYPVLLQPESQTYPGQGADPPAGWGMTVFLRWNLWSGRGRSTSWGPLTGVEYPQGLQHDHYWVGFSSVQSLSHVQLFATPWIAVHQASLSITNSWSWLKLVFIKLAMPSSHIILCCPLLLLSPIPPSIRVFSSESTLCMRWPKYWNFSFSISPSNEQPGLISFRMG